MNTAAEKHVRKAVEYVGRGEDFYRKAADEIIAAQQADPGLTYAEIAAQIGRSPKWVKDLVGWSRSGSTSPSPYTGTGRPHQDQSATRKVLRDAPLERVEQVISELPPERQQAIAAVAGDAYLQARRDADERARRLRTPQEEREEENAQERLTRGGRQAVGAFTALGIVGHLEQATEELRELIADASLAPEAARRIEQALEAFTAEFAFARTLLGEEQGR